VALIVDAENKVQQRMLLLDRAIDNQWLVLSGLAPGDRVVVEGLQKIRPGVPVKALPFEGSSAADGAISGNQTQATPKD
jgi:membrane fusion protein (multidrug efflux system)